MNFLIVLSSILWAIPNYMYRNDIVRNFVSATHATLVVLFYLFDLNVYILYYLSMGYYICDTVLELSNVDSDLSKFKISQLGVILHHVILLMSLHYLLDNLTSYIFLNGYFLAEMSNYPLYIRGHLYYTKCKNAYLVFVALSVHAALFFLFRLCFTLPIIYNIFFMSTISAPFKLMAILLYVLSASWFYKIVKQIYSKANVLI